MVGHSSCVCGFCVNTRESMSTGQCERIPYCVPKMIKVLSSSLLLNATATLGLCLLFSSNNRQRATHSQPTTCYTQSTRGQKRKRADRPSTEYRESFSFDRDIFIIMNRETKEAEVYLILGGESFVWWLPLINIVHYEQMRWFPRNSGELRKSVV